MNDKTNRAGIRTLVVEDDRRYAEQLCALIDGHREFAMPVLAATLAEARSAAANHAFDIVTIDVELPDGNGLALLQDPNIGGRKVILTVFGDEETVLTAISTGADGYLLKDTADIVDALLSIHAGHAPLTASVSAHLLNKIRQQGLAPRADGKRSSAALSPREIEIVQLMAYGHSYGECADQLGISHHTVADHIKNIYRKLAVRTSAAAVYSAVSSGLIPAAERE